MITGWMASKWTIKIMISRLASDCALWRTVRGCSPPGPVTTTASGSLIMNLGATRLTRRSSTRCSGAWKADSEHERTVAAQGAEALIAV